MAIAPSRNPDPRPSVPEDVVFSAELRPHRSSTLRGIHLLIAFLLVFLVPVGVSFLIMGAWPVMGFMGLELVALYVAFRLSLRRGRLVEVVNVTRRALTVERTDHWGKQRSWSFPPQWLRVQMDNPPRHESQLKLGGHGKELIIGAFLTPEERLEVAVALRDALERATGPDLGSATA